MKESGVELVPAQETRIERMTDEAKYAYTVHAQIVLGTQMVEDGLYQMAKGFKIMRDEKLYKEFGYKSFEEYCETETSMNRQNVYKYISIAENLSEEFVSSRRQIGVKKLEFLTALDEETRTAVAENVDLENTSVRELQVLKKALQKAQEENTRLKDGAERRAETTAEWIRKYEAERQEREAAESKVETLRSELKAEREKPVATVEVETDPKESKDYKDLYALFKAVCNDSDKKGKEIESLKVQLGLNTEDLLVMVAPASLYKKAEESMDYATKTELRKYIKYREDKR